MGEGRYEEENTKKGKRRKTRVKWWTDTEDGGRRRERWTRSKV